MPDRKVKLTTAMPEGDANGLNDIQVVRALMADPQKVHVALIIFKVPVVEADTDADTETGKVRIQQFEVIPAEGDQGDARQMMRLLRRAHERRTGATTLDHDLEDDVRKAFEGIDLGSDPDEPPR